MDGVTQEAHWGETMRNVLGAAADNIELAFERVISTGKPFLDCELGVELSARTEESRWIRATGIVFPSCEIQREN